jgi:hypothetical protein
MNTKTKPFGHSVKVRRAVRVAAKGPFDRTFREETVEVRRRGSRKTLDRAVRMVRGFIRLDSEVQEYTSEEWVRVFGTGNERGTSYGQV